MTNTQTHKRKRTYHPVVAMHSRRDLHRGDYHTIQQLAYLLDLISEHEKQT